MLHLHDPRRYEVSLESFMEEILVNHSVIWMSLPMLIPLDTSRTLQLMSYIFRLQTFGQPKQVEILFGHVQPFLRLKGFFSLSKRWGLGVHEILETTMLIWCWPMLCIPTTLIFHLMNSLSEQPLTFHHHLHQFCWIRWWRRRGWIHVRMIFCTSSAARHL